MAFSTGCTMSFSHGVTVSVRDYGPGVPEAELTKIFEPFYRVQESRDRGSGGHGLGLSIALGDVLVFILVLDRALEGEVHAVPSRSDFIFRGDFQFIEFVRDDQREFRFPHAQFLAENRLRVFAQQRRPQSGRRRCI